jgi:hypothetical protein
VEQASQACNAGVLAGIRQLRSDTKYPTMASIVACAIGW